MGNLWSSTGTLLASATFTGESTSGWQEVNFTTPVAITANTVYVASYHTNTGHYSLNSNYFANAGADNAPLHALANSVSANGVYRYGGSSAFPNQTFNSFNYWVDVVFEPGAAPTPTPTPTIGLVAAYSFEEGSGANVADVSLLGNIGTISGATWTTNGRFGKALSFDGSGQITVNDSAFLHLTTGMTLEAWVNPTAVGGWRPIIFKQGFAYVLQGSSGLSSASAPSLGGSFSPTNLFGTTALPLNTWSHLAATYDGTTMRLYVNGVQVASRAQTGPIKITTGALNIGGNPPETEVLGRHDRRGAHL